MKTQFSRLALSLCLSVRALAGNCGPWRGRAAEAPSTGWVGGRRAWGRRGPWGAMGGAVAALGALRARGGDAAAPGAAVGAAPPESPIEAVAEEVRALGGAALAVATDVRDGAAVEAMVARAADQFGGADILVNNAAIYPSRPWHEVPDEEWDDVLAVNLRGCFLCARTVYPHMKAAGWGRIVNIASITFFTGNPLLIHYVSSKGGVIGFTRALAREVGPDGITVNCISPGAFPTAAEGIHPDPDGYNRYVLDHQSLRRRGRPEDVANAVLFLASDAASFITGQTLGVDGGWAMH